MFCDEIYPNTRHKVIKHNGQGILQGFFLGFAKTSSNFGICLKSLIFGGMTCQASFFFFFFFFVCFFLGGKGGGGGGYRADAWAQPM